ncbi:hypothetical protein ACQCT3_18010 [Sutcliffiella horikoshii]|uniref:hypothetical protein n=1 Tax=Sutcliffiella horikoshii TaxID=79883 RepID=UPI003CE6F172
MKAIVVKSFRDKSDQNKTIVKGSFYEASEERIKELVSLGYVKVEEKKQEDGKKKAGKNAKA